MNNLQIVTVQISQSSMAQGQLVQAHRDGTATIDIYGKSVRGHLISKIKN